MRFSKTLLLRNIRIAPHLRNGAPRAQIPNCGWEGQSTPRLRVFCGSPKPQERSGIRVLRRVSKFFRSGRSSKKQQQQQQQSVVNAVSLGRAELSRTASPRSRVTAAGSRAACQTRLFARTAKGGASPADGWADEPMSILPFALVSRPTVRKLRKPREIYARRL